jgi:hypothetical protein
MTVQSFWSWWQAGRAQRLRRPTPGRRMKS